MSFYLDRPLNFAHRGASHEAPANTLAAFLLAVELGADGIELDVHLSKDGHVVVIHDFDLAATTNGQGLVCAKTLVELKELDTGSWFDPVFAGQRIPTLQEVIDAVGHRLLLNIELKTSGWGDGGLAAKVGHIVEQNGLVDRVILSSFNPLTVARARWRTPQIATGLLYAEEMPLFLRKAWLRRLVRPTALHPHYAMVDAQYVWWANKQAYRVHVWTADDPGDMRRLMRAGVDIIITNRPDLLREVMQAGQVAADESMQRLPAALQSG
jgi:glycerophosphoryl diester phosphodiesterase